MVQLYAKKKHRMIRGSYGSKRQAATIQPNRGHRNPLTSLGHWVGLSIHPKDVTELHSFIHTNTVPLLHAYDMENLDEYYVSVSEWTVFWITGQQKSYLRPSFKASSLSRESHKYSKPPASLIQWHFLSQTSNRTWSYPQKSVHIYPERLTFEDTAPHKKHPPPTRKISNKKKQHIYIYIHMADIHRSSYIFFWERNFGFFVFQSLGHSPLPPVIRTEPP